MSERATRGGTMSSAIAVDDGRDGGAALIVALADARRSERAQVGGKAAALGEMLAAGLPVPPGFCITTCAFRRFLSAADATATLAALDAVPAADGDGLAALGAEIRSRLAAVRMPTELSESIVSAWRGSLHAAACAVRSSATAEDLPDASFAGQLDTVLNVRDADALLCAVRQCWLSVFSHRTIAYRARLSLGHAGVRMAVVVQALVHADAAGVLFTVNPITGRHDEVLIEACVGLGESVVSGRVTPDRFVVRKDLSRILHRTVSNKTHAIVPAVDGGVIEQTVAVSTAQAAALSDATALRVTGLGAAVEQLFGAPQDMEWAVAGDDVFVLQSRPITTALLEPSRDVGHVWTNMNTGEILPDVVSPLTWSFLQHTLLRTFADLFAFLGFDIDDSPLVARIGGRLYFNLNVTAAIARAVPMGDRLDITALFGGSHGDADARRILALVEQNLPRARLSLLVLLLKSPRIVLWWLYYLFTAPAPRLAAFASWVEDRQRQDLDALSESDLVAELQRCAELFRKVIATIGGDVVMAGGAFAELDVICTRWLPTEPDAINQLLSGVGGMASAEAGLDMWRLGALAHTHAAVARTLLGGDEFADTRDTLYRVEGGHEFLARWDEFMARHGHHARGEIELMNRRWAEDPDYVLGQVRSYLSAIGGKDPVATHRAQSAESMRRAAELGQRLGRLKRMVFHLRVRRARRGMVCRENLKSEGVRLFAHARRVALALGARLAARDAMAQADDVFHLTLEELAALSTHGADQHTLVSRRRAEFERYQSITPPPVVVGQLDTAELEAEMVDASSDRFRGLGVSPGLVSGPARVILRADADQRVRPGEILVAPFTDPGWTPYFQLAAGLVTDLGGLLSHGSIVAREYGLPAVVNVGSATRMIQTGDLIELDGTHGEVRILQRKG
jgi:rifampicin phosphotransferase